VFRFDWNRSPSHVDCNHTEQPPSAGGNTCRQRAGIAQQLWEDRTMGRGILLWMLGVPIPIIILLALFWH
jgi:hypothetical protein